jgi:hypothetical protein
MAANDDASYAAAFEVVAQTIPELNEGKIGHGAAVEES